MSKNGTHNNILFLEILENEKDQEKMWQGFPYFIKGYLSNCF